jgi:DUF1365 family protein
LEPQVHKVQQALLVLLVQLDQQEQLDPQVLLVQRQLWQVQLDLLDLLDPLVQQVRLDHKAT